MNGERSCENCDNPAKVRGLCTMHYQRFILQRRRERRILCSIPECGSPVSARGWCHAHYTRWRKYDDPLAGGTKHGDPINFYRTVVLPFDGNECLVWPFQTNDGYGQIALDGSNRSVSRMLCEEMYGPPPTPKHEAAHSCGKGDQGCVAKGHLSWKTPKENSADKIIHGTTNRGERSPTAKITNKQALEIRRLCAQGVKQTTLADQFGVYRSTISRIVSGERWAWLG